MSVIKSINHASWCKSELIVTFDHQCLQKYSIVIPRPSHHALECLTSTGVRRPTRYKMNCIQHNSIEFLDVSIIYYVFIWEIWEDTTGRSWMKLWTSAKWNIESFLSTPWTLVHTYQNKCSEVMQCRSYTKAYLGLCPRKIPWCMGKNNVES